MQALISADMTLNVLLFGGIPDDTISSHAGRILRRYRAGEKLFSLPQYLLLTIAIWLDYFFPGHCELAIVNDEARAEAAHKLEDSAR